MPQRRAPGAGATSISSGPAEAPLEDQGLPWQSSGIGDILWRAVKSLGIDDPLGVGAGSQQKDAMVGGLPEGINPGAIEHMLKTMGLDIPGAEGAALGSQASFPNGLVDAAGRNIGGTAGPIVKGTTNVALKPLSNYAKDVGPGIDKAEQVAKYLQKFFSR